MSSLRLHLAALALTGAALAQVTPPPPAPAALPKYALSGPYSHDNLTIFFLRGEDPIKGKKLLTLEEALKAKKVVVHETKNVNELAIENVSDEDVFVQAGDIVKGGQQDRTIALDVIVPGKSGRLPLGSFCVERGRWSRRGGEDARAFGSSGHALASKDLKLAARGARSQAEVWNEVMKTQDKLKDSVKAEVRSPQSSTSLQLTLEHKKVAEALDGYVKKLEPALDAKMTDVVGYALVINGKVASADVYANADLFRKLWPKLVRASAIEALGEKKPGVKVEPVKPEVVTAFLAEVAAGKRTERKTVRDLCEVQLETARNVYFETKAEKGAVVRRSYIAK